MTLDGTQFLLCVVEGPGGGFGRPCRLVLSALLHVCNN